MCTDDIERQLKRKTFKNATRRFTKHRKRSPASRFFNPPYTVNVHPSQLTKGCEDV